jgi:site-specific recombinase XerC
MGTITICIDDATEEKFREVAKNILGEKKGYLGRATTEAITQWISDKEQEKIAEQALALLEKGHPMGKRGFRSRKDMYDRKPCAD